MGVPDLGTGGNGDYGLETVVFANSYRSVSLGVDSALVAAINDTNYYQGFIGVGVTQSRFESNVTNPLISQLAETYGDIPSHSYGYTAGAHYRMFASTFINSTYQLAHHRLGLVLFADKSSKVDTPGSLTLGGYDTLRFEEHDVRFNLDPYTRIPSVNLRAISATVSSPDKRPSSWSSSTKQLSGMNESVQAIIDTTTPYLYLPRTVCDRFAESFNLTWSDTFGVYLYDPTTTQFSDFLSADSSLSFSFSLSSYDNVDNYGNPLQLPGVVNITVTSAAFAQLLRYPFKNAIAWDQSSVPYFPLKRANESGPYIIGRAFMQEAYMIMNYDRSLFSVHQALYPEAPASNYSLGTIERPSDSPYPAYVDENSHKGLTTAQTVGIVIAAFAVGSAIGVTIWCCCRRRKRRRAAMSQPDPLDEESDKEGTESIDTVLPKSPVKRMLSIIIRRKRSKKPAVHEVHGSSAQPVEVGADAHHEVFELPVPPEPVELDSSHHDESDDITELGMGSTPGLSSYEAAQIKLARQLQGPVPSYSPPSSTEKSSEDVSPVAHYRPADEPSPASSPTYANSNSLPYSLPSPLTPHPDWAAGRHFDFPSPMTVAPPTAARSDPSHTYTPQRHHSVRSRRSAQTAPTYSGSTISRSSSANVSPTSPIGSLGPPPSPTYQRTPIDPTRIVCLGPLPENVQLPHHRPPVPQLITQGPRTAPQATTTVSPLQSLSPPASLHSLEPRRSTETLGSNYTVEEETRMRHEVTRQESMRDQARDDDDEPDTPLSMGRIDAGSELIHVPQLAEKRYSWEEEQRRPPDDI